MSIAQGQYQPPSPTPISPTLPRSFPDLQAPFDIQQATNNMSGVGGSSGSKGRQQAAPPTIHFNAVNPEDGSDDEDDDDDDGGASRPKKKTKKGGAAAGKAKGEAADPSDSAGGSAANDEQEKGRRKIEIEYIQKKEKRHITFSKRKAGIMKKAYELATLTGTQVLLLVVSETGIVYTFTTAAFQPLVGAREDGSPSDGQRLIQQCLAVDPADGSDYISPPPDGPLLPLPPKATKRPFEANSSIHGGQIALRTRQQRPNPRKGRPSNINTGGPSPVPELASPSVLQHPHPMDHSPMQLPPSPHRLHPMSQQQQQQQHPSPSMRDYPPSPGLPSGRGGENAMQSAQEYAEMMRRTNGGGGGYGHPGAHRMDSYPPPPGDYVMTSSHQHQMLPPPPHSPVDRHYRPQSQSPHLHPGGQHHMQEGPMYATEDSHMMPPLHHQQQQHQSPQRGGPPPNEMPYSPRHAHAQAQLSYEDDYGHRR